MPPENERMARMETTQTAILSTLVEIKRDLKQHMSDEDHRMDSQDKKIGVLQVQQSRTARDVGWIKKIGAAAWGVLGAYIHFK